MSSRPIYAKHTLAYRFRCLSEALGWPYLKVAEVSGIPYSVIKKCLAAGGRYFSGTRRGSMKKQPMLHIETLKKLLAIEATYGDILRKYRRNPTMQDRTPKANKHAIVKLRPIEVRRPTDLREVGSMGADSKAQAETEQQRLAKQRREFKAAHARARGWAKKIASGWRKPKTGPKAQPGRSNITTQGEGIVAQGISKKEHPKRNYLRARKTTDGKSKEARAKRQQR